MSHKTKKLKPKKDSAAAFCRWLTRQKRWIELGLLVTPIVRGKSNGYSSFLICPDGSKEGWETSDEFDAKRAAWLEWVKKAPRIFLNYAHISYGGDNHEDVIVHEHD